jgi:hypothetical protein
MNMLLLLLSQALLVSAVAQNVGVARHLLDQQAEGGFGKRVVSGTGAAFPCVSLITSILVPQKAAAHCTYDAP